MLSTASSAVSLAEGAGAAAAVANATLAGAAFTFVATQLGSFTSTITQDTSTDDQTQVTVTMTTSDSTSTTAAAGGPGQGDVLVFYKNLVMVWGYANGQLHLCPINAVTVSLPVAEITADLAKLGLSAADVQSVLALDPFFTGGPDTTPPSDRFVPQGAYEYGGTSKTLSQSMTRDTKTVTTTGSYTSVTQDWEAGPILRSLLGLGEKDTTTVKLTNAVGQEVSTTVSLTATLAAGPHELFSVMIWYDQIFGTFAFQQLPVASAARLTGTGEPGQEVSLEAGGQLFQTVVGADGKYAFFSATIPAGNAAVSVAGGPAAPVQIAQ